MEKTFLLSPSYLCQDYLGKQTLRQPLSCYWEGELPGIREQEKNLHFTPTHILSAYIP